MLPDIDLLQIAQFFGYPGIALAIFLESGVFFGVFLPGASLLFTAGLLAGTGVFNIWILVTLVIAAAILGDNVGYWFGAKVGRKLFQREDSRFFKKKYLEETQEFFDHYGKITIVLARFVPIVRTFAPILAGVAGMDYRLFLQYNALGAFVWAGGFTLAGYYLGTLIPDAERYLTPILLGIIFITMIPIALKQFGFIMQKKKARAFAFDLDNTLAGAGERLSEEIATGFSQLLATRPVAIISGASFERMSRDVLSALPSTAKLENLMLFADTAASCFRYESGEWKQVYKHTFPPGESERIAAIMEEGLEATGIVKDAPLFGQRVLARDTQITLAAVGIDAPADVKESWDPRRTKRKKLKAYLDERISDYDIRISSRTAIDITQKGVDKATGVRAFARSIGIEPKEILFIGDDLKAGGNDAIVIPTGVMTRAVTGPAETAEVIRGFLRE